MINITDNAKEQIVKYFDDNEMSPVRVTQNDNG